MATLVAWNLASQRIMAETGSGDSDSLLVQGTPAGAYIETGWVTLSFQGSTFHAKCETCCDPAPGEGKSVTLSANGAGWKDGESEVIKTGFIVLAADVSNGYFGTGLVGGPEQSHNLLDYEEKNFFGQLLATYNVKLFIEVTNDMEVVGERREVEVSVRIVGKIDVYSPPGVFDRTIVLKSGDVVQNLKVKKIAI